LANEIKFWVFLEMKSGTRHKIKVNASADDLGRALSGIDQTWRDPAAVGYVMFGGKYFSSGDVAAYWTKKRWF